MWKEGYTQLFSYNTEANQFEEIEAGMKTPGIVYIHNSEVWKQLLLHRYVWKSDEVECSAEK